MSEGYGIPKEVQEVVNFERPKYVMRIRLPLVTRFEDKKLHFILGMHTDMMGSFLRVLDRLKPEVREKLLIQGRVLDAETWYKFSQSKAYRFFFTFRECRGDLGDRREVAQILVPKDLNLTVDDLKSYLKLGFNPTSLAEEYSFRVGWYPASFMAEQQESKGSFNSLAPFIGAVNQFEIGSNNLNPGVLRNVGIRLIMAFEQDERELVESGLAGISREAISASSDVFELHPWDLG